jgi:hypothetical protein
MKTKWLFALAALIGFAPGLASGSARAATYTVLVGAEDARGCATSPTIWGLTSEQPWPARMQWRLRR